MCKIYLIFIVPFILLGQICAKETQVMQKPEAIKMNGNGKSTMSKEAPQKENTEQEVVQNLKKVLTSKKFPQKYANKLDAPINAKQIDEAKQAIQQIDTETLAQVTKNVESKYHNKLIKPSKADDFIQALQDAAQEITKNYQEQRKF